MNESASDPSSVIADGAEKLLAQLDRGAERARSLNGCGGRELFFDATHLHTQMIGCAGHDHTLGTEFLHDDITYLGGQSLLHLQTTCVKIDETCKFA